MTAAAHEGAVVHTTAVQKARSAQEQLTSEITTQSTSSVRTAHEHL